MGMRSIYVGKDDEPVWAEAEEYAAAMRTSLSRVITSQIRLMVRERRNAAGLPVGFQVPASMKDPKLVRAEMIGDQIRAQVVEALMLEEP